MDAVGTAAELHIQSFFAVVDNLLGSLVSESVIGLNHRPAEPMSYDAGERSDFKHSRERKFLLIRTERTKLV